MSSFERTKKKFQQVIDSCNIIYPNSIKELKCVKMDVLIRFNCILDFDAFVYILNKINRIDELDIFSVECSNYGYSLKKSMVRFYFW